MKTQLAALPNIGCSAPWYLWSGWEGDRKLEIEASECAVPTDTNREMADYSFLIPLVSDINREFACIWFYFTHSNLTIFLVMFFFFAGKKINQYLLSCGDVWPLCLKKLLQTSLQPNSISAPFPPILPTMSVPPSFPPLSLSPLVIPFHDLSCCNDRLRQTGTMLVPVSRASQGLR